MRYLKAWSGVGGRFSRNCFGVFRGKWPFETDYLIVLEGWWVKKPPEISHNILAREVNYLKLSLGVEDGSTKVIEIYHNLRTIP